MDLLLRTRKTAGSPQGSPKTTTLVSSEEV